MVIEKFSIIANDYSDEKLENLKKELLDNYSNITVECYGTYCSCTADNSFEVFVCSSDLDENNGDMFNKVEETARNNFDVVEFEVETLCHHYDFT